MSASSFPLALRQLFLDWLLGWCEEAYAAVHCHFSLCDGRFLPVEGRLLVCYEEAEILYATSDHAMRKSGYIYTIYTVLSWKTLPKMGCKSVIHHNKQKYKNVSNLIKTWQRNRYPFLLLQLIMFCREKEVVLLLQWFVNCWNDKVLKKTLCIGNWLSSCDM